MKKIVLLIVFSLVLSTQALKDPAMVYCTKMGYEYSVRETSDGELGVCVFPDGTECDAQEFMTNRCGDAYSYCTVSGYGQKTGLGAECKSEYPGVDCGVCVLDNGSTVMILDLMTLDLSEGVCGDGNCVLGEDYETCPEDCPMVVLSTSSTLMSTTTTLEPTTTTLEATTTTIPESGGGLASMLSTVFVLAVLLVVAFVAYGYMKKKKNADIEKQREEFLKWEREQKK